MAVAEFPSPKIELLVSGRGEFPNGTKSLVLARTFPILPLVLPPCGLRKSEFGLDWKIRVPSSRLGEPLPGQEFPNRAKGGTSRAWEPSTGGLRKGRKRLGPKSRIPASRSGPVRPRKSAPLQRNGHANFRAWSFVPTASRRFASLALPALEATKNSYTGPAPGSIWRLPRCDFGCKPLDNFAWLRCPNFTPS